MVSAANHLIAAPQATFAFLQRAHTKNISAPIGNFLSMKTIAHSPLQQWEMINPVMKFDCHVELCETPDCRPMSGFPVWACASTGTPSKGR